MSIIFHPGPTEQRKLIDSLKNGFTAAIDFKVKVFTKNKRAPGLFGEKLMHERDYLYTGKFDPFTETYKVEENGDILSAAENFQQFLTTFLRCDITGILKEFGCLEDTFLLYRVRLDYINLHPPLNLLDLFLFSNRFTSSWVRMECSELEELQGQNP